MTSEFWWNCLAYMGSPLVPTDFEYDPSTPPPDVWLRLAKIPPNKLGLADKGFIGTDRFYPFFNRICTPPKMQGRRVKQHHETEMEPKRKLCNHRYTSEAGYSRYIDVDGLKDIVPYKNIALILYMLEWGHAMINLGKPLRLPGRNSGLPVD
jgi:hypothetical protein